MYDSFDFFIRALHVSMWLIFLSHIYIFFALHFHLIHVQIKHHVFCTGNIFILNFKRFFFYYRVTFMFRLLDMFRSSIFYGIINFLTFHLITSNLRTRFNNDLLFVKKYVLKKETNYIQLLRHTIDWCMYFFNFSEPYSPNPVMAGALAIAKGRTNPMDIVRVETKTQVSLFCGFFKLLRIF